MIRVTDTEIRVRQATKKGYAAIPLEEGRYAVDLSYPNSNRRRGRVQGGGVLTPTLTTVNQVRIVEVNDKKKLRIRKLTPRECGRLMGVKDEDITKMAEVNSNTQLYKQFGNSIVVNVLYHIMLPLVKGEEEE